VCSLHTDSYAAQHGHKQCGAAKSRKVIHTMHALPMDVTGLAKCAYIWSIPHVVHSPQELAVAGGVGWLAAGDFTVCAAQLEGVAGHPGGLWVLPTAATHTCGNSTNLKNKEKITPFSIKFIKMTSLSYTGLPSNKRHLA